MIEKFERLEDFEFLLMDEVGIVQQVRSRKEEPPELVISMEDGSTARCSTTRLCCWKIDAGTGERSLSPAPMDRRHPPVGTPVTFAVSGTKVVKVLLWQPRLFEHAWPEVRVVEPVPRSTMENVLWQGRQDSRIAKELPGAWWKRGTGRRREVCVAGRWYPYNQIFGRIGG